MNKYTNTTYIHTHTYINSCSVCCTKPSTCSCCVSRCDANRVSQPLFTTERHRHACKARAEPLTTVCTPHSISQYLCKQRTRLNFSLESPRMRAYVTGGYFPFYASCGPTDARLRYFSPDGSEGIDSTAGMLWIRFRF